MEIIIGSTINMRHTGSSQSLFVCALILIGSVLMSAQSGFFKICGVVIVAIAVILLVMIVIDDINFKKKK